ncbi:MAG: UvrB/UvrC motif-containing protein [Verrucomicrobia bacterium]|nr:UvrB/UvrC motif-containing protein [Verrucomicrobiota bacterium]
MLCDICKENEATVHFSQVVGEKVRKIDICEGCAKAKGLTDPGSVSMLGDMLGEFAGEQMPAEAENLRCPACGFTLANFKKTGRLGCGACYETFEGGLKSLLRAMHKGERHIGKVPAKAVAARDLTDQVKSLEEDLQRAISEERYEHAALIRDKIRAVETKMKAEAAK